MGPNSKCIEKNFQTQISNRYARFPLGKPIRGRKAFHQQGEHARHNGLTRSEEKFCTQPNATKSKKTARMFSLIYISFDYTGAIEKCWPPPIIFQHVYHSNFETKCLMQK